MRGKPCGSGGAAWCRRIIPAHAGQTGSPTHTRCGSSDHPRACGANPTQYGTAGWVFGSSPRMRGKLDLLVQHLIGARIIPAHAGQTVRLRHAGTPTTDHPRACGANPLTHRMIIGSFGSSPRMRGKQDRPDSPLQNYRIIPAHAGQTLMFLSSRVILPDHPRACGANFFSRAHTCGGVGSSPRMRGKLQHARPLLRRHRIIPAHAGQT